MTEKGPELVVSSPPFVRSGLSTPHVMREVILCALLVVAGAVWTFGIGALLTVAAATAGAVFAEWLATRGRKPSPLTDWSAALTGILLGLTLPPTMPLWMAFLGGAVGIGLGKSIWGGLGQNLFNPALVGRAFLQAAFPTAITTWAPPVNGAIWTVWQSQLALPFMRGEVDVMSGATPLGAMKFQAQPTGLEDLFLGNVSGSLGETSAALLLAIGLWMAVRRLYDWRLPLATLLSVALLSGLLHLANPAWPGPLFELLSGGLLFAAVFMVTDPVTSPTTPRGAWIFGAGVGALVVLIRTFGGLPEGVMYAILLMNALVPHIERFTQPKPFGAR
ncbi:MAG: RnfABCDGE type electron transport complex subunit D [Deltaproteobacteria bacterium]|nr:MAG: RnfABCDGE type electron transport complex subunit D [Deltaproteobacteria bacterium]